MTTHAIFNASGKVLALFTDRCGTVDPLFLATETLRSTYSDVDGAFAADVCTWHMEPSTPCRICTAQLRCDSCDWPRYACDEHQRSVH
ncbi:hypothetical protein [Streptomyces triculaminicus]|uniref:hypothetical protein n=1 Tax=Streptomyces triculaminicus TaxID=2816232 RepID=UPI00379671FE